VPSYKDLDPIERANRDHLRAFMPETSEEMINSVFREFPDLSEIILGGANNSDAIELKQKIVDFIQDENYISESKKLNPREESKSKPESSQPESSKRDTLGTKRMT
jgi:hypothetical protein